MDRAVGGPAGLRAAGEETALGRAGGLVRPARQLPHGAVLGREGNMLFAFSGRVNRNF